MTQHIKADVLIIDGRHLLWRTSDVHNDLSANVDGVDIPTGGMYGFLNVLIRIHARYGGVVYITWEGQGRNDDGTPRDRNFRFELYPSYKGKDEEIPPDRLEFIREMMDQEARLKLMLTAMGVRQYLGIACEGDDVTGRLAREASERGQTVVIYSGDSDLRQLVRFAGVFVIAPETIGHKVVDHVYDTAEVEAKHGVPPVLLAQLKALIGGKDNLPGVPGVGKKYGVTLLGHYGSLTRVLRAALEEAEDWPLTPRIRRLVAEAAPAVLVYYKVSKVRTDVDMEFIEPLASQRMVVGMLRIYRFQSLASPAELQALMTLGQS